MQVPLSDLIFYKYGVRRGGEFLRWENISKNRVLDTVLLPGGAHASLITTSDEIDSEMEVPAAPPSPSRKEGLMAGMEDALPDTPQGGAPARRKSTCLEKSVNFTTWNLQRQSDSWRDDAPSISSHDGVVVVSLFLPVMVHRKDAAEGGGWAVEWDYENLLSLQAAEGQMRVTRVGIVRFAGTIAPEEEADLARALQPFNCVPIFLEKALARRFYREFCKGVLWPVFHHVVDVYGDFVTKFLPHLNDLWQCYTQVNRHFRDKIVEVYNVGDFIWVHGFHLLLLPSFLSRTLRVARIGLFLHTPFPSSEIFRTLPFREDLLRAMLSADQIGFHLFEYARHFVTCCRRILGLHQVDGGQARRGPTMSMLYQGRQVQIVSIHAGIEGSVIDAALLPAMGVMDQVEELRRRYVGDRFVFLGIDKVESLKGLHLKLDAWGRVLRANPELAKQACMLQVGLSAHEREQDYKKTEEELRELVGKINSAYGTPEAPAVVYLDREEQSCGLQQRLPFLLLGDCLVNTVGRDGLNRLPLEFVLAHAVRRKENPGVMILSEFTSCMRVLRGALRVNPWKLDEVADCMTMTLAMSLEQRRARHAKDEDFVLHHSTLFWATQVLSSLKSIRKSDDRSGMSPVGLGLNYRVVGMESAFAPLDTSAVTRAYRSSKQRVIFLDYGGTILEEQKKKYEVASMHSRLHEPAGKMSHTLELALAQLCGDRRNTVFVVTGRERGSLLAGLEGVKNVGLAAEHGLFFRWPREHVWETLVALHDQSWQVLTKTIMKIYVMRTNGTYIEDKGSTILWKFEDADPDFGFLQSKELEDHLTSVLAPFAVEVLRGGGGERAGGYLEVRPMGVNKGAFVEMVLEKIIGSVGNPDFVIAIGDDASDEMMFTSLKKYEDHSNATVGGESRINCYSCTVGKKPTEAHSYLHDTGEVVELLQAMARVSTGFTRNYSTSYLSEMQSPRGLFSPAHASHDQTLVR